jgi:hypothetical protein
MPRNLESQLQISCVRWFKYQYPQHLIASIPNGGHRNKVTAGIMKAEGVLSGMPDLFIPVPSLSNFGLFIEMKAGKGVLSANQKDVIEKLQKEGYRVEVCRELEEFMEVVNDYLKYHKIFTIPK